MDGQELEAAGLRFMQTAAAGRTLKGELIAAAIVGALLALLVGAAIAWATWPAKPVPEVVTAAPQIFQADGSVVAARAPDPHPPKTRYALPKASTEERRGEVVVAPAPAASTVQVDYSLVRSADGGRRMVFDSPDGKVLSAVDIPIDPGMLPPPAKPWAAGLSYGTNRSVGLWVDRDLGSRLRVGAAVQRLENGKAEAQLRVGVRW
jgi:hypothetical protein